MYVLRQSGNIILAYDLQKFLLIIGYLPKENSGFTCSRKQEFTDPQEALRGFSRAVSNARRPMKKAAAWCMEFIHKHSGSIYGIVGWAGMIFLILTAGASDSGVIEIGQAAVRGIVALLLVLIGVYGSNHPYGQGKGEKASNGTKPRIGKLSRKPGDRI